jgi:hypothetical protein
MNVKRCGARIACAFRRRRDGADACGLTQPERELGESKSKQMKPTLLSFAFIYFS